MCSFEGQLKMLTCVVAVRTDSPMLREYMSTFQTRCLPVAYEHLNFQSQLR